MALLLVNAVPLVGVLFWNWSLFAILILYWLESGIVGAVNVLKIVRARGPEPATPDAGIRLRINGRLPPSSGPLAPFFILHYGIFWVVHGVFVVALFGRDAGLGTAETSPATLLITVVGLAISHLFSYRQNYIGRGEYLRVSPGAQMFSVYGRVVVLHLTVIIGGFAISSLESPVPALVVMVIAKTAIDLGLHLREHRPAQPELTTSA